ncbi:MAG: ABC transporter ATP-binding protein [Melioribacteraceae bacterium]|nr:ABC transporter ATP-binding protein [Melioribacteraceae bacterium]
MTNYTLKADAVTQIFGRRLIFDNINFEFKSGNVYGLAGHNGSGKSTLAKIIADIIAPTRGKIIHKLNEEEIASEKLHNHMGFVSPYLVLYDEFSAEENLKHFAKIRGTEFDTERVNFLFNEFDIYNRRKDLMKGYSSGMKQRIKFIFALLHSPELLLLDEPTSNLDNEGKDAVYKMIKNVSEKSLVIVASNEETDLSLCTEILEIEKFKPNK